MAVVGDKLLDLQQQLEAMGGANDAAENEIKILMRQEEEKRANYKVLS